MITVDASGKAAMERRRTWLIGGILLVAYAMMTLVGWMGTALSVGRLPSLLISAAFLIFAVGIGRGGSVTARRPLGTGALIALALWHAGAPWLFDLIPDTAYDHPGYFAAVQMLTITGVVVELVLAIIAVTQIGRTGVVPPPWRWAPLWVLIAVIAGQLPQTGAVLGSMVTSQDALVTINALAALLNAAGVCFLGVLAIVLGTRREPASVVVY
ncbi:hypothetical protein WDU99_06365 [Microbacterium sp. Mu-80]|uniref:Uncharacterized protein n=1 Tax=Microbacterium bandirmense TaxID=3122050 RepID=A0ABU8L9Y9_9MICO